MGTLTHFVLKLTNNWNELISASKEYKKSITFKLGE
jgi:hypothetical protein